MSRRASWRVISSKRLNYYHRSSKGEKLLPKSSYAIANRRTGKTLDPAKTFYEAGVWQGDELVLL